MSTSRKKRTPVTEEAPDAVCPEKVADTAAEPPRVQSDRVFTVADLMGGPCFLPAYHTSGLTPGERRARDEKNALVDQGLWWD